LVPASHQSRSRAGPSGGFDVVETTTDELGSATANLAAQTLVRGSAARG
jgi:hypothetical protein